VETDDHDVMGDAATIFIPWSKPPSKKPRQILLSSNIARARPIKLERRAALVGAIARGRRWLNELEITPTLSVEQIARRERCSARVMLP